METPSKGTMFSAIYQWQRLGLLKRTFFVLITLTVLVTPFKNLLCGILSSVQSKSMSVEGGNSAGSGLSAKSDITYYRDYEGNVQPSVGDFSMRVTEENIESFSVKLPPFLPDYKNPCWIETVPQNFSYLRESFYYKFYHLNPTYRPRDDWESTFEKMDRLINARKARNPDGVGWRIRCFPYFFVPGFTKSGTSDLYKTLTLFPDFIAGIKKEPKYWNQERLRYTDEIGPLTTPKLSDYLDLFDPAAEKIRNYVVSKPEGVHYHPGMIGDFDPMVIWKMPDWNKIRGNQNQSEPKYLTPHHLYSLNPKTKIIVLMRNPVDRTFSHYKHFVSKGGVDVSQFHLDIEKAVETMDICLREFSLRECVHRDWVYDTNLMKSLIGGIYHVFVRDWLDVFSRNQFLFIKAEDYFSNRTTVLLEIFHFLKVETPVSRHLLKQVSSITPRHRSVSIDMAQKTRNVLDRYFLSHNRKLAYLLQDTKWHWNK